MQDIPADIITKAAGGDLESFELIYKATSSFVFNVAYRVVNNRQDAEEITQEVFLTVYHKLNTFRFQSSFKTWIYRVTANSAINYSKRISRERNRTVEFDDQVNAAPPQQNKEVVEKEYHAKIVASLLNALNSDQRTCVVLRNIEGLSYQEIADVLGININTVRSRLKRARETMLSMRKEVMTNEL